MTPIATDRTHGANAPADVLDFSASINPLGPPPSAVAASRDAADHIGEYPTPRSRRLEAALASWMGLAPENVLAGNGSAHLIYLLARVLRPARPFVAIPTFTEIANALTSCGCSPDAIVLKRERGYRLDTRAIADALRSGADAIFLGRPNNPTGTLVPLGELRAIAEQADAARCWLAIDEAFIDFAGAAESAVALIGAYPRVIVLRSLTKIFAIPGLRLGCVAAAPATIDTLAAAIEPWSVNVVAEAAGLACLGEREFIARTREVVRIEREFIARELGAIDSVRATPSCANFLMLQVGGEAAPGEFARAMLARGIAVRDLSAMPGCGPGLYRVAVRMRSDNQRLVDAIARWRPGA